MSELKRKSRDQQHDQREEQQHTPRRRHLHQHRPENILDDVKGPVPPRQLLDFLPIDVFSVEPVAGARIRGELRPQVV